MKRVRISELKSHLSQHLRSVEAGDSIEVMDRARPIAKIVPITSEDSGLEIVPAEHSFSSVRAVRLARVEAAMNSLDALHEERGSR